MQLDRLPGVGCGMVVVMIDPGIPEVVTMQLRNPFHSETGSERGDPESLE